MTFPPPPASSRSFSAAWTTITGKAAGAKDTAKEAGKWMRNGLEPLGIAMAAGNSQEQAQRAAALAVTTAVLMGIGMSAYSLQGDDEHRVRKAVGSGVKGTVMGGVTGALLAGTLLLIGGGGRATGSLQMP